MLISASIGLLRQLFSNHLSGELPPDLGKHLLLANLEVSNNNLSGHSAKIWSLPKLQYVMIQNNRFNDTLPAEISTTILPIKIRNNMFSGFIS